MPVLVAIVTAFALACLGTWLLIRFAPALNIIDRPNERSSHDRPTPRGGGLAIVLAVLAAAWLVPTGGPDRWWLALLTALPIALLGLLDDRFGLSARLRLGVQLAAALAYVTALAGGLFPAASAAVPALLAALAIAWACNLFNFMDGIDGIAGMEALFICSVAGWLIWPQDPALATLLWVIAAGAAGFLVWNWSPARIFMGDVGSAFLGFLIAAIALLTIARGLITLPVWIILWALFLADSGVTLVRRIARGEQWWTAHRSHAYQHLSRRLGSHAKVTLIYAALNLFVILPAAWYARINPSSAWWLCCGLLGIAVALAYSCDAGRANAGH